MRQITVQIMVVVLCCAVSGWRRDEKKFVQDKARQVSATTLTADASLPTNPRDKHEYPRIEPVKVPTSFAAFDPIEIIYGESGSCLIVTTRTVQHRTGLYISRPDEVVPASTKYLIYDRIAPRLYFYQD